MPRLLEILTSLSLSVALCNSQALSTYSVLLSLSELLVEECVLFLQLRVVSLSLSHFVDLLLQLRDEEVLLLACSLSLNTPSVSHAYLLWGS